MPRRRIVGRVMSADMPAFSAWSLLSLDSTAGGELVYPDELSVRYVYDTTVPNGRYVAPGDLAVVRDNRIVFGAGWIDSIVAEPGRKIRYRCPSCGSAKLKRHRAALPLYRCQVCAAGFDVRVEEELEVQVFTANYSRTWRPADIPFSEEALDPAYVARAQQNAIRRLDQARLRPILEAHLVTGDLCCWGWLSVVWSQGGCAGLDGDWFGGGCCLRRRGDHRPGPVLAASPAAKPARNR